MPTVITPADQPPASETAFFNRLPLYGHAQCYGGGMRLILAGGGGATASGPLDAVLARWIGPGGRMLYVPVAWVSGPYESCLEWVRSVFEPLGVRHIEMWTDLSGRAGADLDRFAAVYIGGGNTYRLLHHVRETGFGDALRRYAARGGPVYGGSAGAILLGEDIGTSAHMDPNDVGLRDTTALGLARGHAVWCHYEEGDAPLVTAYAQRHAHPVVALPETAGAVIEGDQMTAVGSAPVALFQGASVTVLPPGWLVPLRQWRCPAPAQADTAGGTR